MKDNHRLIKKSLQQSECNQRLSELELQELKESLLDILRDFQQIAKALNISYSLGGGSALGAVRNGGFIPWDDDIDIIVPRADYDRLRKYFAEQKNNKYAFLTPEYTKRHGMTCARLIKKGTIYRSFNELSKPDEYCGIGIDFFVVENTPDLLLLRFAHGVLCLGMGYLTTCVKTAEDYHVLKTVVSEHSFSLHFFRKKAVIGMLFKWIGLDRIVRTTMKVYSLVKNGKSRYVSIPSGRRHYFGELFSREDICETREMIFESMSVQVPNRYDQYLTSLYGENYVEEPPDELKEAHPIYELAFDHK